MKFTIKYKLIGLISLIVALSIIPLTMLILYYNQSVITEKTLEICKNLSYNVASAATEELIVNTTYDATQTVIKNLSSQDIEGLERAYVINYKGDVISSYVNPDGVLKNTKVHISQNDYNEFRKIKSLSYQSKVIDTYKILQFVFPIYVKYYDKNVRLGEVIFEFNEDVIYLPIRNLRDQILLVSAGIFIIAIIVTLIVSFRFVKPIQILSQGAKIFGEGNLEHRIRIPSKDELGELAFSFNQMAEKIQDFTQNLEEKVKQRTHELNLTLQQVQALKTQQDGDYFLTSLLLQPFIGNHNTSSNIQTDFIIKQKKQFTFKKWKSEIGGDYCFTSTIRLGGKNYLFFINADAMGKSIQGAGGLLVLGSVINSVVLQAKHGKAPTEFPEIWLRNLYYDLQQIFLSFDGTMYISCVYGLIDEECGFMYYTNIEHPFTIIYRKHIAQFLEEENLLKKLGVPAEKTSFYLRTFILEPDDQIFIGSDGKDDLIYTNEEGEKVINEDEYLILKIIEKQDGNLQKILSFITEHYELMDDISILKIHFIDKLIHYPELFPESIMEQITEIRKNIQEDKENQTYMQKIARLEKYTERYPSLSFHIGNLYYQIQNYQKAYEYFYEYYHHFPYNNEILFAISKTLWKLGKQKEAIDFGEMLYLRDPNNINNTIHLTKIYIKTNIFARGEQLLEEIKRIQKDHPEVENLKKELQEAKMKFNLSYNFNMLFLKGLKYYKNKNYKKAIEIFEEGLQYDMENVEILIKLANSYAQIRNFKRAKEYYLHILEITPNNYHVMNNLGVLYFKENDMEKAKIYLEKALSINPLYSVAQTNIKKLERYTLKS